MYDDALVYMTERDTEARYWRFKDLFAVLPIDRHRFQVLAYEGGGGDLRPFTFQLKSELPDTFARALWARVNPPAPGVTTPSGELPGGIARRGALRGDAMAGGQEEHHVGNPNTQ